MDIRTAAYLAADKAGQSDLGWNWLVPQTLGQKIFGIICLGIAILMAVRATRSSMSENAGTIANLILAGVAAAGLLFITLGTKIAQTFFGS